MGVLLSAAMAASIDCRFFLVGWVAVRVLLSVARASAGLRVTTFTASTDVVLLPSPGAELRCSKLKSVYLYLCLQRLYLLLQL